jgi:hypothetical protein
MLTTLSCGEGYERGPLTPNRNMGWEWLMSESSRVISLRGPGMSEHDVSEYEAAIEYWKRQVIAEQDESGRLWEIIAHLEAEVERLKSALEVWCMK